MKLCGDMFYYSICNSHSDTLNEFFAKLNTEIEQIVKETILSENESKYYRKILEDKNLQEGILLDFESLDSNTTNIFYNSRIPNNVPCEYRIHFSILFQAIRLAALMHDVSW